MKGINIITALDSSINLKLPATKAQPAKDFKSTMDGIRAELSQPTKTPDVYQEITQLQQAILKGEKISAQQLIYYQIKAGQFNLQVELISKVSDAALTTLRKFQNSQQ